MGPSSCVTPAATRPQPSATHGLIFLCPGEAYNQPPLLIKAHDVGKVLTAGPGLVIVGDPVGTVQYHSQNQELRLGQPFTITKANDTNYVG